jgi:uncharacterized protein (DUF3084 family)
MSDTPETDAEHAQFAMGGFTLDFCRKLERERDAAREDLENMQDQRDLALKVIKRLEQERDEARTELAQLKEGEK